MKKGLLFAGVFAFILGSQVSKAQAPAATNPNQTQLLEKVTANPGEMKISYEKYLLPNGLTLIVHEDHSDPIVHVEVTYHVGSARETPGKSGFAHFFEHMMFQGSMHVRDEEHFKIVQGAGGQMNGTTNRDRTNYFETLPANYLETALWLEADRMGFLLDSVTQKKFEVQRATVKNEKGQRVDNVPFGKTEEIKDAALYPSGHPYSWPTIGYLEDLDRVDVNDLKNFFMRWYGPNNACVVVTGDVKPADVVMLTEKYFGPIPRGPEVRAQRIEPVRLPDNKYANYGDNVPVPLYQFTYPTVKNYHNDEAALDVLGFVLGNGSNSIIYKNFVKPEKAIQAFSYHSATELAGEFVVAFYAMPNFDGDNDIEKGFLAMLNEFDTKGVNDDDLNRAKGQFETSIIQSMQSIGSRASVLSQTWYLSHGNTKLEKGYNLSDELARYTKVTKEDVMRVYRQYVKGRNYTLVNVFPKKANAAANKDESVEQKSSGVATKTELEYKGLSYTVPKDNFDRSVRPTPGAAKLTEIPNFYAANWDNGIKVIGTETKESPVITILLNMKGGNIAVGDPSKTGLASLTADMMGEATQNYTSEQFENEMDKLGSSISFGSGTDNHFMQVICLKKNLDATLKLVEEKLMRPKFNADEFKLNQSQNYQSVNSQKYNAAATADLAFNKLIYGKSIAAEPVGGTLKSIKSMGIKDVQSFYDKFYAPDFATLTIVGDVTEQEIMSKVGFLKSWAKKGVVYPPMAVPVAVPNGGKQVMLVDKYKAAQSEIRIGNLGQNYDWNGKFFKTNAMNYPLGGSFNSRLNLNLREDKGFTYGIRSYNSAYRERPGVYEISTGVRTSATDSALKEIMYEVNNYRDNGITDEELEFMKNSITQSDALRYETNFQKASFLNRLVEYNLPKDYIRQQNLTIKSLTKEEINALAKEVLQPDKMIILIVGDKEKVKAPIEKLGYKIQDFKDVEVATYEKN
ncbi:MAG: insulinase family protein [Bacteroidia bacterium]|nr:insulinase family protein [Bacteroidia bacterium]MCF8447584.1 insulinase family protein [Bacteroidia bacterium]